MPFTTPLLAGTRLRNSPREGVELVVPSPSGGEGVYILQWAGVRALCNPTVHDTLLFQRCCRLAAIEPATIREAALDIARQGHAGREAATAAEAAAGHDHSQRVLAHFLLVSGLVAHGRTPAAPSGQPADLDRLAAAVLERIAPSLGHPAADLAASLVAVANIFAPAGITGADLDARIPRLLMRLKNTHAGLADWLKADPGHDIGGLGQPVTAALQLACESGAAVLKWTRAPLTDTAALLRRWIGDPNSVKTRATRCQWLLDGWERVTLLWLAASTRASRRAALLQIATLLPVLPREAAAWTDTQIDPAAMQQACRVVSQEDTWRRGASTFAIVERNEKLLASAAWTRPPASYCPDGP